MHTDLLSRVIKPGARRESASPNHGSTSQCLLTFSNLVRQRIEITKTADKTALDAKHTPRMSITPFPLPIKTLCSPTLSPKATNATLITTQQPPPNPPPPSDHPPPA
ncbi:hypothetical protein EG328_008037 [Venturia inaequalis]|uniref:Uncharacterized protein n=1 Tax=Venturia inaequalis TaxID=5025 RepID=A0A8H3UD03_VENIN|nr:hypothetical protein EG328_008037 [Venturia inaequalis]